MPPRYAFWTILIDQKPTAFRARDQEELLPTAAQLRRTNDDVVLRWFARGRLWESPEEERAAQPRAITRTTGARPPAPEQRGREWRPGGKHEDPRERFRKRSGAKRSGPGGPKRRG